ncbi:hypothetical protein DFH06DRAFT_986073 [Mycena polygramma]|nr:hypothetical protein DFH06DRAFT_986073 [Mycena polygramma]
MSSSSVPRPPSPPRFTGLGRRRVDFKPTIADYEMYVTLRDRFLTSPRGRAALFAGGIVGQLARQIVDEKVASLGPSPDVFLNGICLCDGHSEGAYWDDVLTEQDIDLICGVYEVATGRINKTTQDPQTSQISWWPKPTAFSSSGLNTGWWSPDCDHWFEERLSKIKSGTAKLHTQTEWKRYIRFYKKSHDIAIANERISNEFLRNKLVYTKSTMSEGWEDERGDTQEEGDAASIIIKVSIHYH